MIELIRIPDFGQCYRWINILIDRHGRSLRGCGATLAEAETASYGVVTLLRDPELVELASGDGQDNHQSVLCFNRQGEVQFAAMPRKDISAILREAETAMRGASSGVILAAAPDPSGNGSIRDILTGRL